MTNPSRSALQGLLAPWGSSFRRDSAFMLQKAAMFRRVWHISAAPAMMISALPLAISPAAMPMLCVPVAQALTGATLGPAYPNSMLRYPASELSSEPGM